MTCHSIGAAARQMGAHPSALIHQLHRLELEIGTPLYHRATPARNAPRL
jgi:DNA-binding transcriptional LysR family regulator